MNRGSSQPSRCLGLSERLQLWSLSCCGSPRDVMPSHSEAELQSTSLSAMIHWAETDFSEREMLTKKKKVWGDPRLLLEVVLFYSTPFWGQLPFNWNWQVFFTVSAILERTSIEHKFLKNSTTVITLILFLNAVNWHDINGEVLKICSLLTVPNMHWMCIYISLHIRGHL